MKKVLKENKDHKIVAVSSNREGYYNIEFYEYYTNVGFKLISIDKDYYTMDLLEVLYEETH